jgi:prolyl-tRNA synthetase
VFGRSQVKGAAELVTVTMDSYGFGVSRAVAVVAGKHYGDNGLAWPRNVAPFDVHIVAAGKDEAVVEAAEALAAQLGEAGVEVLLDDRKASPGVKFADAELIGVPTSVVVGRGLQNGVIEIKDRATLERQEVPVAKACETLLGIICGVFSVGSMRGCEVQQQGDSAGEPCSR